MAGQTAPVRLKSTQPRQRVAAQQLTADALSEAIEVVPTKAVSTFGLNFKVRATGVQFRLQPARDPHQPRLWCVTVRRYAPGTMLDTSGPVWIDRPGRSRTDVAEMIEAIRADIGGWLAAPGRRDLCRWLLTSTPDPAPSFAAGLS